MINDLFEHCTYSVRLVQCELEWLQNRGFIGQIELLSELKPSKINRLVEAARVDIAGPSYWQSNASQSRMIDRRSNH